MIEELKEIARAKGFSGYQGLIRYYVSQGMRADLEELDRPNVEAIARALKESGVSKKVIDKALDAAQAERPARLSRPDFPSLMENKHRLPLHAAFPLARSAVPRGIYKYQARNASSARLARFDAMPTSNARS
jgi:hypothetical protein